MPQFKSNTHFSHYGIFLFIFLYIARDLMIDVSQSGHG